MRILRKIGLVLLVLCMLLGMSLQFMFQAQAAAVSITTQPKSATVMEGRKATFTVQASNVKSYQWQGKAKGATSWTNITAAGGTTNTLSFTAYYDNSNQHNGKQYRCKLTGTDSDVSYSNTVTLTVLVPPTVYIVDNTYQIAFMTETPAMAWVTVGGVKYEDASNGLMRWNSKYHKITVPKTALDTAKAYTVSYQTMTDRIPYTPTHGSTVSVTLSFAPAGNNPTFLCLSDQHAEEKTDPPGTLDRQKGIAAYKAFDVLVMGGDYIGKFETEENMKKLLVFCGGLAKGTKPTVYARGNHEPRGELSHRLCELAGTNEENNFYFTAPIGNMFAIVLDGGEDKSDGHGEYGGTVDFSAYRERETQWLQQVYNSGAWRNYPVRIAICHIPITVYGKTEYPEVMAYFKQWTDILNQMGISLMISGHNHKYQLYGTTATAQKTNPNFPTVLVSTSKQTDIRYSGSFLTFGDTQISIQHVLPDETVKNTATVPIKAQTVNTAVYPQKQSEAPVSTLQTRATVPSISAPFTTHPTVFAVNDTYQLAFATNGKGQAWAEIGGVKYTDSTAGILRYDTTFHRITVPKSALDSAKQYKICFQSLTDRKPYTPVPGATQSRTYPFTPCKSQNPVLLCLSDCHGVESDAQSVAQYKSFDMLLMAGDFAANGNTEANIKVLLDVCGNATRGTCPTLYTRGNRELRGAKSWMLDHVASASNTGKSYYTVRVGETLLIVLDTAEDKLDSNSEYGGTVCFQNFRAEQAQWLQQLANSNEWKTASLRVAISHIPISLNNVDGLKQTYQQWTDVLNQMGISLNIAAHYNKYGYYAPNHSSQISNPNFGTLIVSDLNNNGCTYSGTYLTLGQPQITAENVTSEKKLKATASVSNVYSVRFLSEDGNTVLQELYCKNGAVSYTGPAQSKAPNTQNHYSFAGWVKADGTAADLAHITENTEVYAAFTAAAHDMQMQNAVAPTCTQDGYSGNACCTLCGYAAVGSTIPALGHVLQYVDNGDGTHIITCTRCDYREIENHDFENGSCICGAVKAPEDPLLDETLTGLSRSLNLQSYIGVDYTVFHDKNSVLRTDYTDFHLAVRLDDGEEQLLPVLHSASTYTAYEIKTTATQMTRTLTATLYAVSKADGKTYHGPANVWSVRDGVMELLAKELDANRRTLEADLLNYGAAAQIAFNQHTDDLANSQLGDFAQYATQTKPEISGSIQTDGKGIAFRSKSLALQSTIELQFLFDRGSYAISDLEARIVYDGKTHIVPLTAYGSKYATFTYDGLSAGELRKPFTVTACYKGSGEAITETLYASIEAFASAKAEEYAGDTQKLALLDALLCYGRSAETVFNG